MPRVVALLRLNMGQACNRTLTLALRMSKIRQKTARLTVHPAIRTNSTVFRVHNLTQ